MDIDRIVIHDDAITDLLTSPEVAIELGKWATVIVGKAKANVRVDTGRAQRGIVARAGRDAFGVYVDVVSTARGDNGYPYAAKLERRRPYLRPAIPGPTLG